MFRSPSTMLLALAMILPALSACGGFAEKGKDQDRGKVRVEADGKGAPKAATLNPQQPPSRNFDLSRWKLTIPSGEDIQVAALNDGYTLPGAFYTDPRSGGMVFRSPNRAGTTENSHYSRSELREMRLPTTSAKADANNWRPEDGGTLRARLRVDHVSRTGDEDKRGRVVIGQIHGPKTEVVRLYYDKKPDEARGRIYAGLDSIRNKTTWSPDIVSNADGEGIALGQEFAYEIRLQDRELQVTLWPNNGQRHVYTKTIDPGYLGKNLYFKAGVYNQNDTGAADDYAQATFLALEHSHP